MRRLLLPNYVGRSGAKFETTERFLKNSYVINSTDETLENVGIPLTISGKNTFATSTEELHCFIIGDSGSGKTRRVVMPAIRLIAKKGESMVISDPKGELYKTTANALRNKGYNVQILNFRSPAKGNRWNPLGLVETLYQSSDEEEKEKALSMLNEVIEILKSNQDKEASNADPYWAEAAGNVLRGVSLLILEFGDPGDLTLANVAVTAREISQQITESSTESASPWRRIITDSDSSEKKTFKDFLDTLPKDSPIIHNLAPIITNAKDTRNCIMSVFENMIALYSSYNSLIDMFSKSEIDLKSLGKSPTAIFFILPDDSEALYPIATVFVEQIYSVLVSLADEQENGLLPNRVTFLLDEFANFAKMPSIASMLTAARSRGIRFVLVCQSMDQLNAKYGNSDRETLMSNCRLWLYMKCRNLAFLQNLSELMDVYTSPYTNERVPLISKQDLQQFELGQVLILNDRCRPMMGSLPDITEYDFGEQELPYAQIPAPHEKKPVQFFDLNAVINGESHTQEQIDSNTKTDSLSQSSSEEDQKSELFARTDKRTEKPTEAEKQTADNAEREKRSREISGFIRMMQEEKEQNNSQASDKDDLPNDDSGVLELSETDLFHEGDSLAAAKICIQKLEFMDSTSTRNNLAFLLRFSEIDPNLLSASFSLEIPDLLHRGVEIKDPFSLLNLALYEIRGGNFSTAVDLLEQITPEGWGIVSHFWIYELFVMRERDPEGALVTLLAMNHNQELRETYPFLGPDKLLLDRARLRFADFIQSSEFCRIYKPNEDDANSINNNADDDQN